MRWRSLFVLCALAIGPSGPFRASSTSAKPESPGRDKLIGAWRLISVETIRPNGEVIYPYYGKHPEGLIVYDRSGWMSVQIVSDPKPVVPMADSREAFLASAASEKASAVDGYYAYFGTWAIDASTSTIRHHIKQSLYPAERGEEGVRHFALDGDHLTLTAKAHEMGEDHDRKLVWQRLQEERP